MALVVLVITAAVLLFPHKEEQQQQPPGLPTPADVASRPAPESRPPAPAVRPEPGSRFILEPAPAAPKPKSLTRLATGANIRTPVGPSGRGTLRIYNGASYDAAVNLLDEQTNTARRYVYIRARETTTLTAIAPCQCRLFFALGADWNPAAEEFREDPRFSVFDDLFQFNESETDSAVHWKTFSVTLHPVPEGKAKTTRLSKEAFEKRLGKRHRAEAAN